MMKKNNRGLSTVVTTLIIILLVLVATSIIWAVVSNLMDNSKKTISVTATCLDVDIKATKVFYNYSDPANIGKTFYNVTLSRGAAGTEDEFFAKLVFFNEEDNSVPIDFTKGLSPLETQTERINGTIINATKVEITPYFKDESGAAQLCSITSTFEFGN